LPYRAGLFIWFTAGLVPALFAEANAERNLKGDVTAVPELSLIAHIALRLE
jgi:hypothetical protein